jgi:hypothetical protein
METKVLRAAIAAAAISFFPLVTAAAQSAPQQTPPPPPKQSPKPTPQASSQASPQQPEPPANIPLFPKYRRGLYKNGLGLWVIDGPPQSPPLFTDDPGVPERNAWEINFTTRADLTSSVRSYDFFHVDANYGLLARAGRHELPMQLKLEGPVSGTQEPGQPIATGPGEFEAGLKIQVYSNDNQGIELAVYPQLGFGTGSTAVDKGLVEPGQTIVLPVLVSKQFHFATLVFNAGIEKPFNDPDRATVGTGSAAIGFVVRRHLALMGEIGFEAPFDGDEKSTTLINAGVMQALGHYAVLYGNIGRTLSSGDGETHTFVGVGVKFNIVPDKK